MKELNHLSFSVVKCLFFALHGWLTGARVKQDVVVAVSCFLL